MNKKPTYVVLTASGQSWQTHGPMASEHETLEAAEAAAIELSSRYPQRVLGVYELQSVFGTEQKIVKQSVGAIAEQPRRRTASGVAAENDLGIRMVN